eukprot:3566885-Amphidinium_carterae.1
MADEIPIRWQLTDVKEASQIASDMNVQQPLASSRSRSTHVTSSKCNTIYTRTAIALNSASDPIQPCCLLQPDFK